VVRAQSVLQSTTVAVSLAVPFAATASFPWLGARPLFAANALTFATAAALLARLRNELAPSGGGSQQSLLRSVGAGLRNLWSNVTVRTLTVVGVANAATGGVLPALYVVLSTEQWGVGPDDSRISVFALAGGVGSLVGSSVLPPARRALAPLPLTAVALAVNTACVLSVAFARSVYAAAAAYGLWQATYLLVITNAITVRMELVPDEFLGRVNSAARLVSWGASPLAAMLAGAAAERVPARTVVAGSAGFAVVGVIGTVAVVLMLRRQRHRDSPLDMTEAGVS